MSFFKGSGNIVRFFYGPTDDYCLNSLEIVNEEMLLYRILKEDGFKRVFFLQVRGEENVFYAYDKLSEYSFNKPIDFEENSSNIEHFYDIVDEKRGRRPNSLDAGNGNVQPGSTLNGINLGTTTSPRPQNVNNNPTNTNNVTIRDYVKRKIQTEKDSDILNYVRAALESETKTAVVVGWDTLTLPELQQSNLVVVLSRVLSELNNASNQNILVIHIRDKYVDFTQFTRPPLQSIARQITSIMNDEKCPRHEGKNYFIYRSLQITNSFVGINGIGIDEIANLIRRLKYIEKETNFVNLNPQKVYPLAKKIVESLYSGKMESELKKLIDVRDFDRRFYYIRNLMFSIKENAEKLVLYGNRLENENTNVISSVSPTMLESLTGKCYEYIVVDKEKEYREANVELDKLIGLRNVKEELRRLNLLQRRCNGRHKGKNHYAFVGNPGTGKTEVARLMGKLLKSVGLLEKGHLVEVSQKDLIAGYVGQTAGLVEKKCNEAMGGVLFIDEAYSICGGESVRGGEQSSGFGNDAVSTLIQYMENYRDKFTVILAGYPNEIDSLLSTNPGFKSRISKTIVFPDYSSDELIDIMKLMAGKEDYILSEDFIGFARTKFEEMKKLYPKEFGNAREVRKFLDNAITKQARRTYDLLIDGKINESMDEYKTLTVEDRIGFWNNIFSNS